MLRHLQSAARHLKRTLTPELWHDLTDPRDRRGRRYDLVGVVQLLMLGMVTARRTLRDVERLGHHLACRRSFRIGGTPSDTTLDRIIRSLEPGELRQVLHELVRRMVRSKMLPVDPAIGFSQVAIDGKFFSLDAERLHPQAHRRTAHDTVFYKLYALRAALVSTPAMPTIDQLLIPRGKGEVPMFIPFVRDLVRAYGRAVVEVVSVDAGFCNLRDLMTLDVVGIGFIAAVKGNWPSLLDTAHQALGQGGDEPPTGWERCTTERRGGCTTQRSFARSRDLDGVGVGAIQELWRVRQVVTTSRGTSVEDRYFAVNLKYHRADANQALAAVRAHWGIENASNWVADVVWGEDDHAWVRQGKALESLAILRLIAINVMRVYRSRTLRTKAGRATPYASVIERFFVALLHPRAWEPGFS